MSFRKQQDTSGLLTIVELPMEKRPPVFDSLLGLDFKGAPPCLAPELDTLEATQDLKKMLPNTSKSAGLPACLVDVPCS